MKLDGKLPMANPLDAGAKKAEVRDPKIMQAAKQFESLFVNQLVSAMRKTVVKSGFVPESNAERVYQSMQDQQYAERISDTEQLGLSKMIYEHLLRSSGRK